jgi:sugar lactone lactonase YvrE
MRATIIAGGIALASAPGATAATPALGLSLQAPQSVAAGSGGAFYISDFENDVIERVSAAGQATIVAGTGNFGTPTPGAATSSDLDYPVGVAVSTGGDLYIADFGNSVVERVTPSGTLSVVAGIPGRSGSPTPGVATRSMLTGPVGVAVDQHGNVYIADQGVQFGTGDVVEKVTAQGRLSIVAGEVSASGVPTPGPATRSMLDYPQDVAVDRSGNLYIADGNNVIEKVNSAGTLSIYAGVLGGGTGLPTPGPATQSRFNSPDGVATDAAGDVFVADRGNDEIEEITTAGRLSIVAGTGAPGVPTAGPALRSMLDQPTGVSVDASGDVYVADTANNLVDEVSAGGVLSIVAGQRPTALLG